MFTFNKSKNVFLSGFSLIEALIFVFIFSLISLTFYSLFSLGSRYIAESKNRLGAISLANEKMEIIRNLSYDKIGTVSGIPSGDILEEESVSENGRTYSVKTLVQYVDDDFDGTTPADVVPNDYKKVKVTVSWIGLASQTNDVFLVSRFVPPGIEIGNPDEGTLSINIIDSQGIGIPQASVNIFNDAISPSVNITAQTDDSGNLIFPGAKESIQNYRISISKSGYESVTTVDPGSVPYSPIDSHASVVRGLLNTKTIIQDKLANLNLASVDFSGNPIPNVSFHITGGRALDFSKTVFNIDSDEQTDSNGEKDFSNISPGQFSISSVSAVSGHTFVGFSPVSPFFVSPDETKELKIKFAKNSFSSLLIKVLRNDDSSAISNAQVRLSNTSLAYDATLLTVEDGIAFFPTDSNPLQAGTYDLEVTVPGFQNDNSTVSISGGSFIQKEIKLNPL